jgi:hypothetical protein
MAMSVAADQPTTRSAGDDPGVPRVEATQVDADHRQVGTMLFDNDTPFSRDGTDGGTVGNWFAGHAGNDPHSVATVSFAAAGNFSTSMVMTVWDVNAGTAMVLARTVVYGVPQSPPSTGRYTAMLASPVAGHTGRFIAGIRNTDYTPCSGNVALGSTCDGVALSNGAGAPVPSRGIRVNFTSGSFVPVIQTVGSSGMSLGGINAIFRATGDNLPVELMQFEVE